MIADTTLKRWRKSALVLDVTSVMEDVSIAEIILTESKRRILLLTQELSDLKLQYEALQLKLLEVRLGVVK